MCPSNPAILGLRKQASRSHSMRDQTAHMREKFLVSSFIETMCTISYLMQ